MQKVSQPLQTQQSIDTICCVAGRSGGHIIPCLTWAKKSNPKTILFFTTHTALDKQLLKNESVKHIPLILNNIPYDNPLRMVQFAYHFIRAFIKSLYYLHTGKPKKILSTGGYIALPVCIAARCLRIPIELFELNVSPGKATKFLTPIATTINICFEQSKQYFPPKKCVVTSYPLRFTQQETTMHHANFGLDAAKKTIMILGGSQGSQFLNNLVKQWILTKTTIPFESFDKLPTVAFNYDDYHSSIVLGYGGPSRTNGPINNKYTPPVRPECFAQQNVSKDSNTNTTLFNNLQIIHQTGTNTLQWKNFYTQHQISSFVFAYYPHLEHLYPLADIILCRAGAGTLFEILFFEKPCITIPLETSTTIHQRQNAQALTQKYPTLVTMIEQKSVTPSTFFNLLENKLFE